MRALVIAESMFGLDAVRLRFAQEEQEHLSLAEDDEPGPEAVVPSEPLARSGAGP